MTQSEGEREREQRAGMEGERKKDIVYVIIHNVSLT